jgi:hypothetical protein
MTVFDGDRKMEVQSLRRPTVSFSSGDYTTTITQ